ncbi:Hypothetical predicted protein, partial [Paramuricea clavata]
MSPKAKTDPEKLLFIRFDHILERSKALLSSANNEKDSCSKEIAASFFSKISSLIVDLTDAFSSWLMAANKVSEEKLVETKKAFNDVSILADNVLVVLNARAGHTPKEETKSSQ